MSQLLRYLHRFLDIHGGGLATVLSSSGANDDLSNVVAALTKVSVKLSHHYLISSLILRAWHR